MTFFNKTLSLNWFKILVIILLIIIAIESIEAARNSRVTKEIVQGIDYDVDLSGISGNIDDTLYYAERAANACEDVDSDLIEDAADYAKKAANNSSGCATPSDLIIFCH